MLQTQKVLYHTMFTLLSILQNWRRLHSNLSCKCGRTLSGDQALPAIADEEEDQSGSELLLRLWLHQCHSQRRHWRREPSCQRAAALQHKQGCTQHA